MKLTALPQHDLWWWKVEHSRGFLRLTVLLQTLQRMFRNFSGLWDFDAEVWSCPDNYLARRCSTSVQLFNFFLSLNLYFFGNVKSWSFLCVFWWLYQNVGCTVDALSSRLRRKNAKFIKPTIFVTFQPRTAMKIRILNHTNASQVNHAVIMVKGCVENYSAEVWRKHSR